MSNRVLVVDDNPMVLRLMLRVLEEAGFEAIGAGRVRDARGAAGPFAALVLDIGLPNGQPKDIQAAYPGVPTVTVSGNPEAGPDLRKPFCSRDLVQAVQAVIGAGP